MGSMTYLLTCKTDQGIAARSSQVPGITTSEANRSSLFRKRSNRPQFRLETNRCGDNLRRWRKNRESMDRRRGLRKRRFGAPGEKWIWRRRNRRGGMRKGPRCNLVKIRKRWMGFSRKGRRDQNWQRWCSSGRMRKLCQLFSTCEKSQ